MTEFFQTIKPEEPDTDVTKTTRTEWTVGAHFTVSMVAAGEYVFLRVPDLNVCASPAMIRSLAAALLEAADEVEAS